VFALFIATIMTISAMPVTARIIQDLGVYRTDLGLLIMSALTINDIAGWVVFAVILGFATGAALSLHGILFIVVATLVFTTACLTLGSRLSKSPVAPSS
jgi:Kef-type K+ transport system membrane component KefB